MPLPADWKSDFETECLYTPDHWFLDDIVEWDEDNHVIVARVDTTRLGHSVEAQVVRPQHPKHFPGAVAVQLTGTLGNLHAVYMLGLKLSDGWVGYGTHITKARFGKLGIIGPDVLAKLTVTRRRMVRGTWFMSYQFEYRQDDAVIYTSEQTAAWARPEVQAAPG